MISSFKDKIFSYWNHNFIRNVATLQVGDFAGNITQALVAVLLARMLQPELYGIYILAFGLAGLIGGFLNINSSGAALTLLGGHYIRRNREDIKSVMTSFVKISVIVSFILFVGMIVSPFVSKNLYGNYTVGFLASILILGSIISNFFYSYSMVALQVIGEIKKMTIVGLLNQLFKSLFSVIFVFIGLGVWGAISGHFIGSIIIFAITFFIWKRIVRSENIFPSIREILGNFRKVKMRDFLKFSIWISLDKNLSNLFNILPIVITGIFVATSEITFFKLAFAYINLAVSFIGAIGTLLNVEFPKIKAGDNPEKLKRNFTKISLYSLGITTLLTAGALIVAPLAFRIFYGENFIPSIKYVFALFVYGSIMGLGVGLGPMWRAINKVKISIMINLISLSIGVLLGFYLISDYGVWGTVIMITFWYSFSHIVSFVYLRRELSGMIISK